MKALPPFCVVSFGYECPPEFPTLAAARAHLRELVAESLRAAKRKSRTARKHRLGADSYKITLGSDPRSMLWAGHYITHR
jgi:hypothetical protein